MQCGLDHILTNILHLSHFEPYVKISIVLDVMTTVDSDHYRTLAQPNKDFRTFET